MAKYSHVVAAVELDGADAGVVATARRIARQQSAELTVLNVARPVSHLYAGSDLVLGPKFEADRRRSVRSEVMDLCRAARVPETCAKVEIGSPETAIAEFAQAHHADLIVLGAHDPHGLEYFLGTTATAVLHRAHCDVLGVRTPDRSGRYRRVVVGVDGNPDSFEVLKRAYEFTAGSEVRVLLVVRPLMTGYTLDSDTLTSNSLFKDLARELEQQLVDTVRRAMDAAGFNGANVEVVHGTPSKEIKRYLRQISADLVIMGSGEHVGVGWMIGSTTNNVLQGASCDALVVRKRGSKAQ